MPWSLQTGSGLQALFHTSLFALSPSSSREWILITTHTLLQCPTALNRSWAWGLAPKEHGGVTAFCTALSTAPVPHWEKHPRSCCNATSQVKEACELTNTLRENTHFHSHHLFNLPTEHEGSNRKHCLESACSRVLANSYNLQFLFSNVSAQSCSLLHPSTIFDLNSFTSIMKLMNKQETSISNNLFKTNRSKKPGTMKSVS